VILHGGDLVTAAFLDELEAIGPPVHAVLGNVDEPALRGRLPERRVVELDGVRIGMVHDAGRAAGRLDRLRAAFAGCAAVVFGHSHIPLHERSADGAFQIFNPGSPTDRRRQRVHTMGDGVVKGGGVAFVLVEV
jgi:putative phosphoesterase